MSSPYNHRITILTIGGIVIILGLIGRLIDLQVVRQNYFNNVAEGQRKRASELTPNRGTIYLKESRTSELFPVAVNEKSWIAFAVPRDMDDPLQAAEAIAPEIIAFRDRQRDRISQIIDQTGQQQRPDEESQLPEEARLAAVTEELYDKFNKRADPYEPFLKFYEIIDEELKQKLEEKQIEGIVIEEQKIRRYPEKNLAAHVLGYLGWKDDRQHGRYGVEGFFEEKLKGQQGFISTEKDASGQFIGVAAAELEAAQDGVDIVLTMDRVVQSIIEEELADGVARYGAERGSIIVMNPETGAVLGMATSPSFDPNYYYAISDARVHLNPVVSDIFEPGSILKPVIIAAAINEGKITPDSTVRDDGPIRVADYTINTFDGKHHGQQTMTEVLEQSNNVGMVWVGQQLGAETMYDYLRRFGIGEKTGIQLEGETRNTLKEPADWNVTTVATTAFGQGVALTPLQALNSINTIANGGMLTQPHIVSTLRNQDGTEERFQPTAVRRTISPGTAADVSAMMVSVIENGVAGLAQVPGYYLAGKTGTAQVPDETGKYSETDKIISFVGFGPITDPKFSILIKLDNPSGLSFASGTAAPMFGNIAEKLLNYYQVPPDYDVEQKQSRYQVPSSDEESLEVESN